MYKEMTPGEELDGIVETDANEIEDLLVQCDNYAPCFTERFLRATLSNRSVLGLLRKGAWAFRWDNAGKVDTVLRSMGYTPKWDRVLNYDRHYWIHLVGIAPRRRHDREIQIRASRARER